MDSIVGFLFRRELGKSAPFDCPSNLSQTLAEEKSTIPIVNKACELSGTSRSTFLVAFSHDRTLIASTHGDHTVRVSESKSGKCRHVLHGHPRTPWTVAFHPSSNDILATGCLGGQVRIWDLRGGGCEVMKSEENRVIASLTFHPTDQLLVIAAVNEILVWDWSQPEPFVRCRTSTTHEKVRWCKFDRVGHHLYTGIANKSTIHSEEVSAGSCSNIDLTGELGAGAPESSHHLWDQYRRVVDEVNTNQRQRIQLQQGLLRNDPMLPNDTELPEPTSQQASAIRVAQQYAEFLTRQAQRSNASNDLPSQGSQLPSTLTHIEIGRVEGPSAPDFDDTDEHMQQIHRIPNIYANNNHETSANNSNITRDGLYTLARAAETVSRIDSQRSSEQEFGFISRYYRPRAHALPNLLEREQRRRHLIDLRRAGSRLDPVAVNPRSGSRPVSVSPTPTRSQAQSEGPVTANTLERALRERSTPVETSTPNLDFLSDIQVTALTATTRNPPVISPLRPVSTFLFDEDEPDLLRNDTPILLSRLNSQSSENTTSNTRPTLVTSATQSHALTRHNSLIMSSPSRSINRSLSNPYRESSRDPRTRPDRSLMTLLEAPVPSPAISPTTVSQARATVTSTPHPSFASSSVPQPSLPSVTDSLFGRNREVRTSLARANEEPGMSEPSTAVSRHSCREDNCRVCGNYSSFLDSYNRRRSLLFPRHHSSINPRPSTMLSHFRGLNEPAGGSMADSQGATTSQAPSNCRPRVSSVIAPPVTDSATVSIVTPTPASIITEISRPSELSVVAPSVSEFNSDLPAALNLLPTTQVAHQPQRLATIIETEVREAISRIRSHEVDLRQTMSDLDSVQRNLGIEPPSYEETQREAVFTGGDVVVEAADVESLDSSVSGAIGTALEVTVENSPRSQPSPVGSDNSNEGLLAISNISNVLDERIQLLGERVNSIQSRLRESMQEWDRQSRFHRLDDIQNRSRRLRERISERRRLRLEAINRRRAWLRDPFASNDDSAGPNSTTANNSSLSHMTSRMDHLVDQYAGQSTRYERRFDRLSSPGLGSGRSNSSSFTDRFFPLRENRSGRSQPATPPVVPGSIPWHALRRRNSSLPSRDYDVNILDDTINRQNDLQAAINRTIASAFMNSGDVSVPSNIVMSHRIQRWNLNRCKPDLTQADSNVVVRACKLHNDATADISQDGRLLATFVSTNRGFPDDTVLAVYSLSPHNLGQCLYTKSFGPNAISVSISPLNNYVMVGLASKRLHWVFAPKQMVAQIYKLKTVGAGEDSMEHISDLMHPCDLDLRVHVSVNSARWLPNVGEGVVYCTNRGDLHLCKPGWEAKSIPANETPDDRHQNYTRQLVMQLLRINSPRTNNSATQTTSSTQGVRRSASTQTDQGSLVSTDSDSD